MNSKTPDFTQLAGAHMLRDISRTGFERARLLGVHKEPRFSARGPTAASGFSLPVGDARASHTTEGAYP